MPQSMVAVEVGPLEVRQFQLLIKRNGGDPAAFRLGKHARMDGKGYRVRVVGRGAATVYEGERPGEWTRHFAADLASGVFGIKETSEIPGRVQEPWLQVQQELHANGLAAALGVLNARVPHRFTGVYQRDGEVMRNVALFEKPSRLEPVDLSVVPVKDSFCQYVLRDSLFVTNDSGRDDRLAGHPYSGVVGCYVGVPISRGQGTLDGTLCHFDLVDQPIDDDEFLLLQHAAGLFSSFI
jgi:hypothetical protein